MSNCPPEQEIWLLSARERFRQRFASVHGEGNDAVGRTAVRRHRRKDYKGSRRRLNLRLDETLVDDLDILQFVEGIEKNTFCEEAIRAAVAQHLTEVRMRLGESDWEEIVRRAKGTKKPDG